MKTFPRCLTILSVFSLLVFLAGGSWFWSIQTRWLRLKACDDLRGVAQLKVDEILRWRGDRLADGEMIPKTPFLVDRLVGCLKDPAAGGADETLAWFDSLRKLHGYSGVLLVDTEGKVRLVSGDHPASIHEANMQVLAAALRDRKPLLTDLQVCSEGQYPHMGVVVPLFAQDGGAAGAVVLVSDARKFLFPLIQTWPTSERTAETLLVRREGDDVLFLNDLRHQKGAAFMLRIPLSRTETPAVMAVLGREGIVEGRDYRGDEVLSFLKPVPDSPWFLVAKVDMAEVLSVLRRETLLLLFSFLGLIVITIGIIGLVWHRNVKAYRRALLGADAAQRKSKERHRATLMSVGDGVIVTDSSGRVELENPVAEALTGWKQEEACGKPLEEILRIVNEETRRPVESLLSRVLREQQMVSMADHTLLIARDGTEHPVVDTCAPIRDGTGEINGVVLVFRDQTTERALKKILQEDDEKYRTLFESARDGIALAEVKTGVLVECNEALCRMVERDRGELVGRKQSILHPPQDTNGGGTASFQAHLTGDPGQILEDVLLSKSGRLIPVEIRAARIWRGGCESIMGIFRDISERKQSEEALRGVESRYRILFEHMTQGAFRQRADGCLMDVNPAALEMFGVTREKFLGRTSADPAWDMIHEDGSPFPGSEHPSMVALRTGKPVTDVVVGVLNLKTQSRIWMEINAVPEFAPGEDKPRQVSVTMHDISRNRELQGQFNQTQKMESVGRLAGGVAHDFNNLLTAISGYAQLLREDPGLDGTRRGQLDMVLKAAEQAAILTRQLLAFGRKQVLRPRVFDLNVVVSDMGKMLRRLISENIELVVTLDFALQPVKADRSQVEQVILNLVLNARDAMLEGGRLLLQTRNVTFEEGVSREGQIILAGSYVELSVTDTGMGLSEEARKHLFEPFFTTKEVGKGTGLGLSMVYGIVTQSGGHIQVESEPSRGTTFHVYFPRSEAALEVPSLPPVVADTRGSETILLVEDSDLVRRLAREVLRFRGYRVLEAQDGKGAVELAKTYEGTIHLLLTDFIMPGMTGHELAGVIVAARPGVKVIYMSGYAEEAVIRHGQIDAISLFIPKPFVPGDLLGKVREALDRPSC